MIPKFISELSANGKKLLVVALILVIFALFDLLLFGPTLSRMAAIDQDIAKEQSTIKQNLHFLGYKDRIIKENKAVDVYITKTLQSEEELISAFLKTLEVLAGKANVTIIKVTPSPGTQEKDYLQYSADLECSGKLADVITFMHLLDTSNELTKVVRFNFSKKGDGDELKASMSVVKVIIGKQAPAKAKVSAAPVSSPAAK